MKLRDKMMILLLFAFLPLMMGKPVLEELARNIEEENMPSAAADSLEDLCPNGSSYCEEVENYPYKAILAAIRNQSELVKTPGLWDPPIEENLEDLVELEEYESNKEEFELYDNGIVPY